MNEETFLSNLLTKRLRYVDTLRENNFEEGIQRLLTDLYPDTAHFIFELLQNAEDAAATKVTFDLRKDSLIFTHNGKRLFNNKDVEAITGIGDSPKRNDVTQIGKFGIGFKAVFAYTATPRVYSGSFSFEIRDMVCPHQVENNFGSNGETIFEFPFNHKKKQMGDAFDETADGLISLKENILLFLNNIETIEWDIDGKGKGYITRLAHSDNHFEVEYKNYQGKTFNSHWLRLIKQIDPNSKIKNVAVAYKLDFKEDSKDIKPKLFDHKISLSKQMQIIPIDGQLSIFFPAEKETTKLKFHIHGPFAATIARDSIPHNNNDNKKLLQQISSLLAESLHDIKKLGLLSVDFLAVLPNDSDELSEFYKPLQAAVIKEMKTSSLVPTHSKEFAPAQRLYHGPADIREVISNDDLQYLASNKSILWAAGVMKNSRQEKFIKTLGIDEWSWQSLINSMQEKFNYKNDKNDLWLEKQTDEWIQKFYVLLKEALQKASSWSSSHWKIVRLQSGEHISGNSAFFPDEENKKNKNSDLFPPVKSELLRGQRKQGVRQFLEAIGVKEVGKEEELKLILDTYYDDSEEGNISEKQHIIHMKKFISYWNSQKEDAVEMFDGYNIFYDESGEVFRQAKELYLDKPYLKTMLTDYFQKIQSQKNNVSKYRLWPGYNKAQLSKFTDFAVAMGVLKELSIKKTSVPNNHPDKRELHKDYYARWTDYRIDEDYTIEGIEAILKTPDTSTSYLVWQCIIKAETETQFAQFCPNNSYPTRKERSSLVYLLRKYPWIPDKSGKFHKSSEITREMLHKSFRHDNRNDWLTAIGFGEDEKKKTEEYKSLKALIKKFGVSDKYIDLLSTVSQLPKEQQDEAIKEFQHHIQKSKNKASFPEKESADPVRRAVKLKEKIADASEKEYEVRERSVRTTANDIKPEVKIYLRSNYTNSDGEMICQICKEAMPFKLDDGSHYFEAVEFIKDFPKECRENYIALCPVCAAKYKYANASKPEDIRSALLDDDNGGSIPITLARENKTLRFVQIHLNDLRAISGEA